MFWDQLLAESLQLGSPTFYGDEVAILGESKRLKELLIRLKH